MQQPVLKWLTVLNFLTLRIMVAAQGVQTRTQYILPYSYGIKTAFSIAYKLKLSDKATRKLEAYNLYKTDKHTQDDIGSILQVDKSTISRWISQVKKAKKVRRYQILEPKSKAPKKVPRKKSLTEKKKDLILEIRREYKCGKDNIHKYLKRDYKVDIHPSTIHRFISSLKPAEDPLWMYRNKTVKFRRTRSRKLLRIKDVEDELVKRAFERFQIDTKYWVINGRTFYVINVIDVITRMVFAYAYTRHTATCAKNFLQKLNSVFHIQETESYIQRDNGSEFMGEFEEAAEEYKIKLITNYVRCPQMNGFVERFNRTLKRELLDYEMPTTVVELNELLRDYVIKYNFKRIHGSIGSITPFERYCELTFKKPIAFLKSFRIGLLHMLWTRTNICNFS